MTETPSQVAHASCVAIGCRGLLILGRPGAGKSMLALELMALGAELVADDQVVLTREAGAVIAAPAPRLEGVVEARGAGLLRVPFRSRAPVSLVFDLDETEADRLPPRRKRLLLGEEVPLILRADGLTPAAVHAIMLYGPVLDPGDPWPE